MYARILIVDDSPAVRHSLRSYIEAQTDWEICDEAADKRMAVEMVQKLWPDVVILDLSMPVLNGLDATRGKEVEHHVSGVMVESLEVVEVEEKNGQGLLFAAGQLQFSFERFLQEAPVKQASQGITNRLFTKGFDRNLANEKAICEATLVARRSCDSRKHSMPESYRKPAALSVTGCRP